MKTKNIKTILEERYVNFIRHGISHKNNVIKNIFRNSVLNGSDYMISNLNCILNKHNIPYECIFENKKLRLRNDVLVEDWRVNLINELMYIRDFQVCDFFSREELLHMLNEVCTA